MEDLKQPLQQTVEVVSYEDIASSSPVAIEEEPIPVYSIPEEPRYSLTDEEINLIALVTMAEAEGESEQGKRLVISTILNRVDSELRYFPHI
jgi:N-acetylmuramoyl-L-alanine amidase